MQWFALVLVTGVGWGILPNRADSVQKLAGALDTAVGNCSFSMIIFDMEHYFLVVRFSMKLGLCHRQNGRERKLLFAII